MKKLLLLSLLVLFGCSEKEEEIEEEIIFPDLEVQISSYPAYRGLNGERDLNELCYGSRTSTNNFCSNALLLGCCENHGDAQLVDNYNGNLVYTVTTKCNSSIKIKVTPGIGWQMGNINVDGEFFGEIEQNLDTEIKLSNSTTNCFTKQPIKINVDFQLDTNLTR